VNGVQFLVRPSLGRDMYRPGGMGPFFASNEAKASSRVSPLRYPLDLHFPSTFLCRKSKTIAMTVADAVADRLAPGYGSRVTATLDELTLAGAPDAWRACGFRVDGGTCVVGDVRIRLAEGGAGKGLSGWSLRDIESTELDGLSTTRSERPPPNEEHAHPNGVSGLDHVVAITPNLDRTVAALQGAGLDLRRVREEPTPAGAPRQAFFRLGAVILEVVQEPEEAIERAGGDGDRPAFFWGLALIAPDLDATVVSLGDRVGEIRDAVQSGRRIATLRRCAGLSVPIALITPPSAPRG
jgi:catechol 2,3-dioxygenase-like lactoylglutathione lyase family enzyme